MRCVHTHVAARAVCVCEARGRCARMGAEARYPEDKRRRVMHMTLVSMTPLRVLYRYRRHERHVYIQVSQYKYLFQMLVCIHTCISIQVSLSDARMYTYKHLSTSISLTCLYAYMTRVALVSIQDSRRTRHTVRTTYAGSRAGYARV